MTELQKERMVAADGGRVALLSESGSQCGAPTPTCHCRRHEVWVQPAFPGSETDPACGWHEPVAEESCSEKEPSLSGHYKEAIIR